MLAFVALCTCGLMYLLVSKLDKIQQINQGLIFSIWSYPASLPKYSFFA